MTREDILNYISDLTGATFSAGAAYVHQAAPQLYSHMNRTMILNTIVIESSEIANAYVNGTTEDVVTETGGLVGILAGAWAGMQAVAPMAASTSNPYSAFAIEAFGAIAGGYGGESAVETLIGTVSSLLPQNNNAQYQPYHWEPASDHLIGFGPTIDPNEIEAYLQRVGEDARIVLPQPDAPLAFSLPSSLPTSPAAEGLPVVSGSGTRPDGLHFGLGVLSPPTVDELPVISVQIDPVVRMSPPPPLQVPVINASLPVVEAPLPYLSFGQPYQNLTGFQTHFLSPDIPYSMGEVVGRTATRTVYVPHYDPLIPASAIERYMAQESQFRAAFDWTDRKFWGDTILLGGLGGLALEGGAAIGRGLGGVFDPISRGLDNLFGFEHGVDRSRRDDPTTNYSASERSVQAADRNGNGDIDPNERAEFREREQERFEREREERRNERPIILDLDGNGIQITSLDNSTVFMDGGDGLDHRTAWAGVGDGVLFYDPDNTGEITERRQYVFTGWDPTATSDMEALASVFDTDGDGELSGDELNSFRIMVTNADGTTTSRTLAELGITSINLTPDVTHIELPDGTMITGQSTFTYTDGSTGTVATTTLATDARGYQVEQVETVDGNGTRTMVTTAYVVSSSGVDWAEAA